MLLPLCHADGSPAVSQFIAPILGGIMLGLITFLVSFALGAIICMTCSECFDGPKRPDKIEEMRKEFNNKLEDGRKETGSKMEEMRKKFFELELEKYTLKSEVDRLKVGI